MNDISLYFKGKKEFTIRFPNKEQINDIFNMAKQFYFQFEKYSLISQEKMELVTKKGLNNHRSLNEEQIKHKNEK